MRYVFKFTSFLLVCTLTVSILLTFGSAVKTRAAGWSLNEFTISTFQAVDEITAPYQSTILNKCKELGLTTIENYFVDRNVSHSTLEMCDSIGLKSIVCELGDEAPDVNRFSNFQNIIYGTNTDASVANAISYYSGNPSLYGYTVWDEPFPENIASCAAIINKFRIQAPDKLALCGALPRITNAQTFPNLAAWQNYVNDYTNQINMQVFAFDYYPFTEVDAGVALENTNVFEGLGYIRLKALQKNVPLWIYIQTVGDVTGRCPLTTMTVERIRLQSYYALAYGAKALSYYNLRQGLLTDTGTETALFQGTKTLNTQLKKLGPTLIGLRSTGIYQTGSVYHPFDDNLSDQKLIETLPDNMILGTFEDSSNRTYILPVNRSYTSSKSGTIVFNGSKDIYEVSKSTGAETLVASNTSSLNFDYLPGEGALYRVYSRTAPATEPEPVIAKTWELNTSTEAWVNGGDISEFAWQAGGYAGGSIIGVDPQIYSGNDLGIDITNNKIVKVTMKNSTSRNNGQLFFITNNDTVWNEAKSKTFTIASYDPDYTVYTIDMSNVPDWNGTLKRLRLDPCDGVTGGSFSLNSITIQNSRVDAWEFNATTEGWVNGGHISGFAWQTGGYVGGGITGVDPQIYSGNNIGISITNNKIVKIRMKNSTSGNLGQIYFITDSDTAWNEAKSKTFTINVNDPNYTVYTIDMSAVPGWMGTLKQIRLDPNSGVTSGSFSVDYFRLQNGS